MAIEFKGYANGAVTRADEYLCYPEDLHYDPQNNGRKILPDIEWLIQSILTDGQQTPVLVRKVEGAYPSLIAGFSRYRAIVEINKRIAKGLINRPKFKVRCSYVRADELGGIRASVIENRFRNSTVTADDSYNVHRLLQTGMSDAEVAAFYFPTAQEEKEKKKAIRWVKKVVALDGLTINAKKALEAGEISESAAEHLAKLKREQQDERLAQGNVTAAALRAGDGKRARSTVASVRRKLLQAATGKGLPEGKAIPEWLRDWLEDLAEEL